MELVIKNMVSNRCKMLVREDLKRLGLRRRSRSGLEWMDNRQAVLVEKIKNLIFEMIENPNQSVNIKISDYLSKKLHYHYTYLAQMFSESQGISIQKFVIQHKIKRIKELILHSGLNISEIAYEMNYSSVGHLSNQFKQITGLSPARFKQLEEKKQNTAEGNAILYPIPGERQTAGH